MGRDSLFEGLKLALELVGSDVVFDLLSLNSWLTVHIQLINWKFNQEDVFSSMKLADFGSIIW